MTHQPPPLDYRSPATPPPPIRLAWTKFLGAAFLGTAVSAIAWIASGEAMWRQNGIGDYIFIIFCVIAALKFLGGLTLLFFRDLRPLGIGLLISLPIGGLLFFIGCASSIHF